MHGTVSAGTSSITERRETRSLRLRRLHTGDAVTLNRTRNTLVIAVAMVAMLAMSITAAFAQYPPRSAFGVACTVSGNTVVCSIVGAQANEQLAVTATCDGQVAYDQTVTADAEGEATVNFAAGGAAACDVSVLGAASGNAGAAVTLAAGTDDGGTPVTAAPTTGERTLPFTGSEVTIFLAVGLALVALGTFAVRRRGAGSGA
jgi:LPXTG-motif cell wall-anchored protein